MAAYSIVSKSNFSQRDFLKIQAAKRYILIQNRRIFIAECRLATGEGAQPPVYPRKRTDK